MQETVTNKIILATITYISWGEGACYIIEIKIMFSIRYINVILQKYQLREAADSPEFS